jgi:hypothetical protein
LDAVDPRHERDGRGRGSQTTRPVTIAVKTTPHANGRTPQASLEPSPGAAQMALALPGGGTDPERERIDLDIVPTNTFFPPRRPTPRSRILTCRD